MPISPGEVAITRADAALAQADEYLPEDEPLLLARASAAELGSSTPITPTGGAMLRFLAAAVGARTVVEIGTGCGTSGIWLLRGMRHSAVLTSVDIEPEHQRMARNAFLRAGFAANRYRLIPGRALDVLPRLSDGAYDMVFCDADPLEYPDYLEAALRLLRLGGIVVFNNVPPPAGGDADGAAPHPGTAAMRELTGMLRDDGLFIPLYLPAGDGMLAAVKRS